MIKSDTLAIDPNKLIKGIRVRNHSIKIYQQDDSKYLILLKRYFMGICVSRKQFIVDDYYTAEDYLRNFKVNPDALF